MPRLYESLVVVLFASAVFNVACQVWVLHRIRHHYPETWAHLGKPRYFRSPFEQSAKNYSAFLRADDLNALADSSLTTAIRCQDVAGVLAILLFIATLGLQVAGHGR